MTVSDNTKTARGPCIFFKNSGKTSAKTGKKLDTNLIEKVGKAFVIGAKLVRRLCLKILKQHFLVFQM